MVLGFSFLRFIGSFIFVFLLNFTMLRIRTIQIYGIRQTFHEDVLNGSFFFLVTILISKRNKSITIKILREKETFHFD